MSDTSFAENGYTYLSREQWGAKYSAGRKRMPKQVSLIVIHHTVTQPVGTPCQNMQNVERVLHVRGLAPGYSYCFDPSGVVLEGAGEMVGAHTEGHNSLALGFALIGNYEYAQPPGQAIIAMSRTLNIFRLAGRLPPKLSDIEIVHHRDLKATACPGKGSMSIGGSKVADWVRLFAQTGA